jgi:hypothetical protein
MFQASGMTPRIYQSRLVQISGSLNPEGPGLPFGSSF